MEINEILVAIIYILIFAEVALVVIDVLLSMLLITIMNQSTDKKETHL